MHIDKFLPLPCCLFDVRSNFNKEDVKALVLFDHDKSEVSFILQSRPGLAVRADEGNLRGGS